ncbi:follicular epithelium yolk protein subunit [Hymenobacter sp. B81]|uniref:follicular epithelium yolk protein subunit n=1 Tax=Hymenobacter sp. B81 TaxID=3344878 RepID=UPI0037DDB389
MAGISVIVTAGKDKESSKVSASGYVQHIITDEERNVFKLQDGDLKSAVEAYFGKRPNDAFLHDPTPWNNLYSTYNWPQVQTILRVVGAEIVGLTSEPVVVAQNTFTNNSDLPGVFSAGVSDSVTDTVESNWSQTYGLEASQSISYGVSFLGSGGGGETSLSFSASFGQGGSQSTSVTVGSQQDVSVELQPGESVTAVLTASRGTLKVRITYQVSLEGVSAVNYNPTFKDHHFWALDISGLLQAAGRPTSFTITEDLEIGYFSNAHTILQNTTARAALVQAAEAVAEQA